MSNSIHYYNTKADEFFEATVDVDMSELHRRFVAQLPAGGTVLDAGCGSGRDALAFQRLGFKVTAFDASEQLCMRASKLLGLPVAKMTFSEVSWHETFDGIWACASLLHVPSVGLPSALAKLWSALKPGGVFYCSFKLGESERESNGRHFTDQTEESLATLLGGLDSIDQIEIWLTEDNRPARAEQWVNALVSKQVWVL